MLNFLRSLIAARQKNKPEDLYGGKRGSGWPAARKLHIQREPECAACGRTEDLEVHHILPFAQDPSRECDDGVDGTGKDGNLITLCADPCHFVHGHFLSWVRWNPSVRADAAAYRRKLDEAKARH